MTPNQKSQLLSVAIAGQKHINALNDLGVDVLAPCGTTVRDNFCKKSA